MLRLKYSLQIVELRDLNIARKVATAVGGCLQGLSLPNGFKQVFIEARHFTQRELENELALIIHKIKSCDIDIHLRADCGQNPRLSRGIFYLPGKEEAWTINYGEQLHRLTGPALTRTMLSGSRHEPWHINDAQVDPFDFLISRFTRTPAIEVVMEYLEKAPAHAQVVWALHDSGIIQVEPTFAENLKYMAGLA